LTQASPASPKAPSPSFSPPPLPSSQSPSHPSYPLLLIFDFDSTITQSSTLPALLSLPTHTYHTYNPPICAYLPTTCPHTHRRPVRPPTAADLSATYYTHLRHHDSSYVHANPIYRSIHPLRKTLPQVLAYQASLRHVERASFLRGKQAFADAGVNASHLEAAASTALEKETVVFRSGWEEMMELVADANVGGENIAVGIISVSWSHQWIRNLLDQAMRLWRLIDEEDEYLYDSPDALCDLPMWDPARMDIRANDIFSKRPASEEAGIYVSADKAREMADMVQRRRDELRRGLGGTFASGLRTIYVGDSLTDLECLLAADIGIVIRTATMGSEQHELGEALKRLGIRFSWLGYYFYSDMRMRKKITGKLWWAQDLEEIVESGILDADAGVERFETQRRWHLSNQPAPTI